MADYLDDTLSEADLPVNPIDLFRDWLSKAGSIGLHDPNAMCLSTIDAYGCPDSRIVLLKSFDDKGFIFFTNSLSNKGRSIKKNPNVALNFFWDQLGKQVRIQGSVSELPSKECDDYFASRSRLSQIGAWASLQSERLDKREMLDDRVRNYDLRFPKDVPRPPHWGGFTVKPTKIEFWQIRANRLHDRFIYEHSTPDHWSVFRLYP